MAESLVFDQAGAPSRNPHDKDVRQHRAEKFGLSDATPAEQASQMRDPKLDRKMSQYPDRSFFATRAALDSNAFLAR